MLLFVTSVLRRLWLQRYPLISRLAVPSCVHFKFGLAVQERQLQCVEVVEL